MEQLKELAKELGQPGADKLWQEAQRRNLQLTRKEVSAYVRSLGSRQVFQDRPKYEGKITATEINDRWAADLIDYNARPSADPKDKNKPFQYVLIVQDIFSRVIFTKALKFKDQETVTEAFKEIVRNAGVPDHIDTDHGNEFKGAFDDFLREKRIYHSVADIRNKNARGTLDAAIRTIRQQIGRIQTSENRRDWAEILPGATQAHNRIVHSSLIGRAPAEVYGNDDLTFNLRERAAKDIQKTQRRVGAKEQVRASLPASLRGQGSPRGHRKRGNGRGRDRERVPDPSRPSSQAGEYGREYGGPTRRQRTNRSCTLTISGALPRSHRCLRGSGRQDRERGRAVHEGARRARGAHERRFPFPEHATAPWLFYWSRQRLKYTHSHSLGSASRCF